MPCISIYLAFKNSLFLALFQNTQQRMSMFIFLLISEIHLLRDGLFFAVGKSVASFWTALTFIFISLSLSSVWVACTQGGISLGNIDA